MELHKPLKTSVALNLCSLSVKGSMIWNSLRLALRECPTLPTFKHQLEQCLTVNLLTSLCVVLFCAAVPLFSTCMSSLLCCCFFICLGTMIRLAF